LKRNGDGRKERPDLTALGQAQSAQASAVGAATSDFGPRVSAYGNWEEDRTSFGGSAATTGWPAVQISVDICHWPSGAVGAGDRRETESDALVASAQQHLRSEVSQAHIHRRTAALQLETAHAATDESAESLRIIKNRYGAGLATITDLLRAEDAERQSQSNYWHAVYGNAMAIANFYTLPESDTRCRGGTAMKNLLWRFACRFRDVIAGCHGGETAATSGTTQTMPAGLSKARSNRCL